MIEFDYEFATDTLGDPKISMMMASDSIHGSILAVVARRKDASRVFKILSIGWVWLRQS